MYLVLGFYRRVGFLVESVFRVLFMVLRFGSNGSVSYGLGVFFHL